MDSMTQMKLDTFTDELLTAELQRRGYSIEPAAPKVEPPKPEPTRTTDYFPPEPKPIDRGRYVVVNGQTLYEDGTIIAASGWGTQAMDGIERLRRKETLHKVLFTVLREELRLLTIALDAAKEPVYRGMRPQYRWPQAIDPTGQGEPGSWLFQWTGAAPARSTDRDGRKAQALLERLIVEHQQAYRTALQAQGGEPGPSLPIDGPRM